MRTAAKLIKRLTPMAKEQKDAVMNLRVRPSVKKLAFARATAVDRSLASYIEQLVMRDADQARADQRKRR